MDGLWDKYRKEHIGATTLYNRSGTGFVCYMVDSTSVFIHDFYIVESERSHGWQELMEKIHEVCATEGLTLITSSVDQDTKTWQQSLKAQLNAGFKISGVSGSVVYTYINTQQGEKHG